MGTNRCFTSGFMAYEYSASKFEMAPFWQFLLPGKLFLNQDMAMFEDYDTYAVSRLKFVVPGFQLMRVQVTIGSLAHEYKM